MNVRVRYCAVYSPAELYFWESLVNQNIKNDDSLLFMFCDNQIIKKHYIHCSKPFRKDFEENWNKLL